MRRGHAGSSRQGAGRWQPRFHSAPGLPPLGRSADSQRHPGPQEPSLEHPEVTLAGRARADTPVPPSGQDAWSHQGS